MVDHTADCSVTSSYTGAGHSVAVSSFSAFVSIVVSVDCSFCLLSANLIVNCCSARLFLPPPHPQHPHPQQHGRQQQQHGLQQQHGRQHVQQRVQQHVRQQQHRQQLQHNIYYTIYILTVDNNSIHTRIHNIHIHSSSLDYQQSLPILYSSLLVYLSQSLFLFSMPAEYWVLAVPVIHIFYCMCPLTAHLQSSNTVSTSRVNAWMDDDDAIVYPHCLFGGPAVNMWWRVHSVHSLIYRHTGLA